jgi:alpha-L-fucosidase
MYRLNRRHWLKSAAGAAAGISLQAMGRRSLAVESIDGSGSADNVQFLPTWESLARYRVPDWFRDAKFGIWAHWGPQCAPERGDWYARHMYSQGHPQYESHVKQYGHPSKFGFKDVIHSWKAEHWDPDALVSLYQRAGARYFFAMANHHDNLDLWDSAHQPWNSVAVGPKRDIVGGWAAAARKHGLRFGVSVHAAHAWLWYETAQGADREGPLAGVPYDGTLTKESGAGTWWEGLDPQQLYAQSHRPSKDFQDLSQIHQRWHWTGDGSKPDDAYCESFRRRTVDLIDKYNPDLLYFDDTGLPLWPISNVGLQIAAHFYNTNMRVQDGRLEAVLFGKILDARQRKCMVWDIERGASNRIEPFPWQTDTCIGGWHYDRGIFDRRDYKSAATVIHMLADIVSKNGNLLLNVPVRGDGTIDEQEREVVEGIAAWMQINGEAIYGTRPWKTFGEGPAIADAAPLSAQGFNEGRGKAYTAEDVRYTAKGDAIYAILLGVPTEKVVLRSLGKQAGERTVVRQIQLVGNNEPVEWQQTDEATLIRPPNKFASSHAVAYKITPASA